MLMNVWQQTDTYTLETGAIVNLKYSKLYYYDTQIIEGDNGRFTVVYKGYKL